MPRTDAARPRQDWWAKSSAGLLLGFSLGIASGCLLLKVLHGPVAIDAQLAKAIGQHGRQQRPLRE